MLERLCLFRSKDGERTRETERVCKIDGENLSACDNSRGLLKCEKERERSRLKSENLLFLKGP